MQSLAGISQCVAALHLMPQHLDMQAHQVGNVYRVFYDKNVGDGEFSCWLRPASVKPPQTDGG